MIPRSRLLVAAGLALTLTGCVGAAIPSATPPGAAPPPVAAPRVTQNNMLIGHQAASAVRLFGEPRLAVTEGAGRKLQFAGTACILDIYYYAPRRGADPLATHVDARTPDGRKAEVTSCIDALRR